MVKYKGKIFKADSKVEGQMNLSVIVFKMDVEVKKRKEDELKEMINEMKRRVSGVWVGNSMAYRSNVSLSGRDMPASTGLGFFFFSRSAKTVTDGHLLSRFLLFPFSFFIPMSICLKNRTKPLFFIILVEFHGGVEVHEYF